MQTIEVNPYSLDVPYGARLVYSLMIDRAEPDGTVKLPYWQAAMILGTTQTSAKRMIDSLVDAGVITREWIDPRHKTRGCIYRFVPQPVVAGVE